MKQIMKLCVMQVLDESLVMKGLQIVFGSSHREVVSSTGAVFFFVLGIAIFNKIWMFFLHLIFPVRTGFRHVLCTLC